MNTKNYNFLSEVKKCSHIVFHTKCDFDPAHTFVVVIHYFFNIINLIKKICS